MQQKEISMEMATSRPISDLEQNNFNRYGELIRTLSGVCFAILIVWASLEFFSLFNITYSRVSMFSTSNWIVRASATLSGIVLYQTHKLLLSSSKQWLYDFWTLRLRSDKATEMEIKKVGFPTVPIIIIILALYLSIIGSFQLVESYGHKATTRSYDPTTVKDMIATLENNQRNAVFSNEKRLKAEQSNEVSSLKNQIRKLENEREKWSRMKVSTSAASTKAKEELRWISGQIREKEQQIENIKAKYISKIDEEKGEIIKTYTAKSDSLLYQQKEGIKAIESANQADMVKEIQTQKEGNWTGVVASLFFLLTFVSCQVFRIKYSVECGIYEKQTYSFIDSLGGMSGIFIKVHLALIKERVSKKLIDFYNRYTVGEISELDNTFNLVAITTASVATENTNNVATAIYVLNKEEMEARFKVLQRQIGNYVGFLERNERLTSNTFQKAKDYLDNLTTFIHQCNDEFLKQKMTDYFNEKMALVLIKEKEVKNGLD